MVQLFRNPVIRSAVMTAALSLLATAGIMPISIAHGASL